jgi:vitamin B12/bleomycin/antimicrobial peptide transport system ATP-binding/permease protein
MLRTFLASKAGPGARWRFAAIVALLLAINGLNVLNSFVGRDFMTALEQRWIARFAGMAVLYAGVFALSTAAAVFLRFFEEALGLIWREWLTRWAIRRYLRSPVLHRLNARLIANGQEPNPAERIADDVRVFTTTTLSFTLLMMSGTVTVIAFSGVMWSISPLLFGVTVLYASLGSFLTILRGRALIRLNVTQFHQEAAFRSELIHVRENAEAVALAGREGLLEGRLERRIDAWAANFRRIISVNRGLGFFTTGYGYLMQIIPILVVAPLFIREKVEFGVVTQSAMAFAHLAGAFSLIVTQFQSISSYAAVVERLGALDEAIEGAQEVAVPASSIEVREEPEERRIAYEGLTLLSPVDARVLVRELSGTLAREKSLRISGPEEARAALFRASAGVWESGSGRVLRPRRERTIFLQERTYLPPSSLRDALTGGEASIPEERILALSRDLDLEPVLARAGGLDVERRWDTLLSVEEQQRLAFAHALLVEPSFVFLNRASTRLRPEELRRMLGRFAERGASVVTDDGGGAPPGFFDAALELSDDGSWRWRALPSEELPGAA